MPIYTIINKKTKKTRTEMMTISEMEQFCIDNPRLEVMCGSPGITYRQGSKIKVDNEFKDRLREIKKSHKGSTIDVN